MKLNFKQLAALLFTAMSVNAQAVERQEAGPYDSHIRTVTYKLNEVTVVKVQLGIVTRIMLERDEKIEIPVVGLSSECSRETDEWCISAIPGSNQIFIRPRDNAIKNNMELHTNKRDYSFVFEVVKQTNSSAKRSSSTHPFFRIVFDYPKPQAFTASMTSGERAAAVENLLQRVQITSSMQVPRNVDPDYGMTPSQRLKAEGIQVRNANYTKQVLRIGQDAEPTMVFDDGRFTYFEFPGSREIPAVFALGSDGQATRVNWHMNGNFIVVHRIAPKFTLRLGDAVVGIFNESFDLTGVETPTATVSPSVVREVKGGTAQ